MRKLIIMLVFLLSSLYGNTYYSRVFYGSATYYAKKFEGRKTASGEIFRNSKLTAASNLFKIGTLVKVTNLSNCKSIVVRINDKSAKWTVKKGRIIDLSKAAMNAIEGEQMIRVMVEDI